MSPLLLSLLVLATLAGTPHGQSTAGCPVPPYNNGVAQLIVEALEAARPLMVTGIPELGVPPLDPLGPLPTIPFHVEGADFRLDGFVNNTQIMNWAQFVICSLNFTMGITQKLDLDFRLQNFHMEGQYDVDGMFLSIFPVFGNGDFTLDTYDTGFAGGAKIGYNPLSDRASISDLYLDVFFQDMELVLECILGCGDMADLINSVLSEIGPPIFEAVWNAAQPILSDGIEKIINNVLKDIPISELINPEGSTESPVHEPSTTTTATTTSSSSPVSTTITSSSSPVSTTTTSSSSPVSTTTTSSSSPVSTTTTSSSSPVSTTTTSVPSPTTTRPPSITTTNAPPPSTTNALSPTTTSAPSPTTIRPLLSKELGNANDFMDAVMVQVDQMLVEAELDPATLPPATIDFGLGTADMKDGLLTGLSTMHRDGTCTVDRVTSWLFLYANIAVENLQVQYTADVHAAGTTEGVTVAASVGRVAVYMVARQDVLLHITDIDQFVITEFGPVDVDVDGLGLLDYVLEPLIEAIVNLVTNQITDLIETAVKDIIQEALGENTWPQP